MKYSKCVAKVLSAILLFLLSACGKMTTHDDAPTNTSVNEDAQNNTMSAVEDKREPLQDVVSPRTMEKETEKEVETMLLINVNGTTLEAELADNSSAKALLKLIADEGSLTLELSDYGGFEKVGPLPEPLPTNDERISTDYGDIILYQGNQFVLYYDTNSWTFTRLAHVRGVSKNELKEILGTGNVTVTLRLATQ